MGEPGLAGLFRFCFLPPEATLGMHALPVNHIKALNETQTTDANQEKSSINRQRTPDGWGVAPFTSDLRHHVISVRCRRQTR